MKKIMNNPDAYKHVWIVLETILKSDRKKQQINNAAKRKIRKTA